MNSENIRLCAVIRAKKGMEHLLKAALIDNVVQKTQAEPGCLLHAASRR